MHATTIVGYTFQADLLCPDCIIPRLPTGPGQLYDGWGVGSRNPHMMSTEANLSEIAEAFGIDRDDEYSFDSEVFPKVVFASSDLADFCCMECWQPFYS